MDPVRRLHPWLTCVAALALLDGRIEATRLASPARLIVESGVSETGCRLMGPSGDIVRFGARIEFRDLAPGRYRIVFVSLLREPRQPPPRVVELGSGDAVTIRVQWRPGEEGAAPLAAASESIDEFEGVPRPSTTTSFVFGGGSAAGVGGLVVAWTSADDYERLEVDTVESRLRYVRRRDGRDHVLGRWALGHRQCERGG